MSRQYHDSFYFQAMTTYDSLIEPPVLIQWDSWITGQKVSMSIEEGEFLYAKISVLKSLAGLQTLSCFHKLFFHQHLLVSQKRN